MLSPNIISEIPVINSLWELLKMHSQNIIMVLVLHKFHPGDQDKIRVKLDVFAKVELRIAQYLGWSRK